MLILFCAAQPHLETNPKLVVKTSTLSVWTINLQPGDYVECDPDAKVDFIRSLSAGRVELYDHMGNTHTLRVERDTLLMSPENRNLGDVIKLKNISQFPLKFMSVENNSQDPSLL